MRAGCGKDVGLGYGNASRGEVSTVVAGDFMMRKELAEKGCVLIPAYNEGERIAAVVRNVLRVCPNVVVIDDGSPDNTADAARNAGATAVLVQNPNQGKGAALNRGFQHAREMGCL